MGHTPIRSEFCFKFIELTGFQNFRRKKAQLRRVFKMKTNLILNYRVSSMKADLTLNAAVIHEQFIPI